MFLYTLQLAKYRWLSDTRAFLLDTTVKTGNPLYAPSWELVTGIKSKTLTEDEYTAGYYALMRKSFVDHTSEWLSLFSHPVMVLGCYCPAGNFCHRHLLTDILEKIAIQERFHFVKGGEITSKEQLDSLIEFWNKEFE